MSRTSFTDSLNRSGPVSGGYALINRVIEAFAVSQTDGPAFWWTVPYKCRIQRIVIANAAQALTGYKVRRLTPASGTRVAASDTQMLGADGGAVVANTSTVIAPDGAGATLLLAAQRDCLQGDQIGIFISNAAVTPNLQITLTCTVSDHVQSSPSFD